MSSFEGTLAAEAPLTTRRIDGVWTTGRGRQRWLYRRLSDSSLVWGDPPDRDEVAHRIQQMFSELAAIGGREVHLLALRWEETPELPADLTQQHRDLLAPRFGSFSRRAGFCVVGVRLNLSAPVRLLAGLGRRVTAADSEAEWDLITQILHRAGAAPLTEVEAMRLEAWWADGLGRDAVPNPQDRVPEVPRMHRVVNPEVLNDKSDPHMWLAELLNFGEVAALSLRGRAAAGTPPPGPPEPDGYDLVRLRDCSIVLASRSSSTYPTGPEPLSLKMLEDHYGVKTEKARQAEAFAETLPLGKPRSSCSDVAARVVAAAGLTARSFAGDRTGLWVGTSAPEFEPVWVDPDHIRGGPVEPMMVVVGDPGAGKSVLLKAMAVQAAASGEAAVIHNPKPVDSYRAYVDNVAGELIEIDCTSPGRLDPFRFAPPEAAAQIAADHLAACVPSLGEEQQIRLTVGLRSAARNGAGCVNEALDHPEVPPEAAELIRAAAAADPMIAAGIASTAGPRWGPPPRGRVTVIESGGSLYSSGGLRPLDTSLRSARAVLRLAGRAALEQIISVGRGLILHDAADVTCSTEEIRWLKDRLTYVGPRHGVMAVYALQTTAPLPAEDVYYPGGYLGRVMAMKTTREKDMAPVLRLCGLEATRERCDFLRNAGPVRDIYDPSGNRGALGLHRDAAGRVAGVLVGPDILELFAGPLSGPESDSGPGPPRRRVPVA